MIYFRLLNKATLYEFINSREFQELPAIPITRHRAISQINNPRADDNDTVLILAYIEKELVGYLGILPEHILAAGEKYKVGSLSCIWVNPNFRGKGIAVKLVHKAHELYERLIAPDYVPDIVVMYQRSGVFTQPRGCVGARIYLRMDLHHILPPKKKFYQRIKPLLYVGDVVMNFFLDLRFLFFDNRLKHQVEYVDEVDDEASAFIAQLQDQDLLKRNRSELNWILKYPWIISKYEGDRDSPRYAFASTDKSFEYVCIKLRDETKKLIAFTILTKRNRVLRTSYCYVLPDAVPMLADVIVRHMYMWKINTLITYHRRLYPWFLQHNVGQLFRKTTQRPYLLSKQLEALLRDVDYHLQDGDVDAVFS